MLKRDLLHPALIEAVLRKAKRLIAPDAQDRHGRRRELQERLTRLDAELGRLTAAIAPGADVASVVEAIKAREQERAEIRQALTALDAVPRVVPIEPRMIRETLRTRLADWLGVLRRQPAEARQALLPLLKGRLLFTPKEDESGRYYEITGVGTVTPLLAGGCGYKGRGVPDGT